MNHCMLLWKKPTQISLDKKIALAFSTLSLFRDLGEDFGPQYLTAHRKSEVRKFEWNFENFNSYLLKHPVNKGNKHLGELGYSASFFSCLDTDRAFTYQITIGNENPLLLDVISVKFPPDFFCNNPQFIEYMPSLFRKCITIFSPFWGCITEKSFLKKYKSYLKNDKPSSIQWINYWSPEIIDKVGKKCFYEALAYYNICVDNGIFVIQSCPIDLGSINMSDYCDSINRILKLI